MRIVHQLDDHSALTLAVIITGKVKQATEPAISGNLRRIIDA